MKTTLFSIRRVALSAAALTLAAALFGSLTSCKQEGGPAGKPNLQTPSEPNSFEAVTAQLDAGGDVYVYLSSCGVAKFVEESLPAVRKAIAESATDADSATVAAATESLLRVLGESGLGEITGYGLSYVTLEPGLVRGKSVLHHAKDNGNGWLWKMCDGPADALDIVAALPEKTALAASGNFRLAPLWEALVKEGERNSALKSGLAQAQLAFTMFTGLDLNKLVAGLGPKYSFVVTLDETRTVTLPQPGGGSITFPEPALVLSLEVNDEAALARLEEALQGLPIAAKTTQGDLSGYAINVPPAPGIAFLKPVVVWKKGQLVIASNAGLLAEMGDVKAGKKAGLAASPAFKARMDALPKSGVGFGYVAGAFQKTMSDINARNLASLPGGPAGAKSGAVALKVMMTHYYEWQGKLGNAWGVTEATPEGFVSTGLQEGPAGK